jgi:hypothetical protein
MNSVVKDLNELGETEQQVVDTLQQLGITGTKALGGSCPIANYLRGKGHKVGWVYQSRIITPGKSDVWFGPYLINFLTNFDRGAYPQLESKTEGK